MIRILLVACLLAVGCGKNPAPDTPPAPVNIELRMTQALGILSEANLAAVRMVKQRLDQGKMTREDALAIFDYTDRIANASKQAVLIMRSGGDPVARVTAVRNLMASANAPPQVNNDLIAGVIAAAVSILEVR